MIIFETILTTFEVIFTAFEVTFIFEAARDVTKIGWSLRLNHNGQI
jgi:hypothetical protein